MCALAAFPIFVVGLLCFCVGVLLSVPGWPIFDFFLCDVFITFCWFLCDCLEFVGLLWCLLLVCPKQQLLSAFLKYPKIIT